MVENSKDSGSWAQVQVIFLHAYMSATASFGLKVRIKKVGGNRIRTVISSLRQVNLGEKR